MRQDDGIRSLETHLGASINACPFHPSKPIAPIIYLLESFTRISALIPAPSSARLIRAAIRYHEDRFNIDLSHGKRKDLEAFLGAL